MSGAGDFDARQGTVHDQMGRCQERSSLGGRQRRRRQGEDPVVQTRRPTGSGGMLRCHDEGGRKTLGLPVASRLQQLRELRAVPGAGRDHQVPISGYSVSTQGGIHVDVRRRALRRCAEPRMRIRERSREHLEPICVLLGHLQPRPQRAFGGLRGGERALDRRLTEVVFQHAQRRRPIRGHSGEEAQLGLRPGRQLDGRSQAEDRIEHAAEGSRQRGSGNQHSRPAKRAAPTDEAQAVGLPLQVTRTNQRVKHPRPGLLVGAGPPSRQQPGALRDALRLDEQLRERRVRRMGGGVVQNHLEIARHLEPPRGRRPVAHADPTNLQVVAGRDGDVESGLYALVVADERDACGPIFRSADRARVPDRLEARGPEAAGVEVAQVEEIALVVLDAVAAPAVERQAVAARLTAARSRDHHVVASVRDESGCGSRRVRIREVHRINRTFAGSSSMVACVPVKRVVGSPFTMTARSGASPGG